MTSTLRGVLESSKCLGLRDRDLGEYYARGGTGARLGLLIQGGDGARLTA